MKIEQISDKEYINMGGYHSDINCHPLEPEILTKRVGYIVIRYKDKNFKLNWFLIDELDDGELKIKEKLICFKHAMLKMFDEYKNNYYCPMCEVG